MNEIPQPTVNKESASPLGLRSNRLPRRLAPYLLALSGALLSSCGLSPSSTSKVEIVHVGDPRNSTDCDMAIITETYNNPGGNTRRIAKGVTELTWMSRTEVLPSSAESGRASGPPRLNPSTGGSGSETYISFKDEATLAYYPPEKIIYIETPNGVLKREVPEVPIIKQIKCVK